jgi:hypothetical protein
LSRKAAAKRFDEGLPQTTLQDEYGILSKSLEIRVGKMSAEFDSIICSETKQQYGGWCIILIAIQATLD